MGRRAFIYERGEQIGCLFAYGACFGEILESVTAIDERTVEFRLSRPDATFMTTILPNVLIDSRAVVEAAYATLAERAPTLDAAEFDAAEVDIADQLESDDPDCESTLERATWLLEAAGILLLARDQFMRTDGTFDDCMYAQMTMLRLSAVAASLRASGMDAIALAYLALSFNTAPVGTGPFRWGSVTDGQRLRLEANPAYHHGPPAAPAIEIVVMRDLHAGQQALLDGEIHWLPISVRSPEIYFELRDRSGLRFAQYQDASFFMLAYNLREGMLFADYNLRAALELCIDKPATVDTATDGTGDPIYSFIPPSSWAYDAQLPRPARDVSAARELIEASGWTEGPDGIYERDGARLATEVFVTAEDTPRLAFMELVAERARDCGFDLIVVPADTATVLRPVSRYPHIPGGRDRPFEAHFVGWLLGYDPHDGGILFQSDQIFSEEQPLGFNFMGYRNDQVDQLLHAGLATYSGRERARIYREVQELIAAEKPMLFTWAPKAFEALDARLGYVGGELNLASPQWYWQFEKLALLN